MRTIKFRAWIKDYALIAEVNYLNIDYKEIVVMIDGNDYEFNCGEYELMQYTGLKDKNGKEIYEGDIITFPKSSNTNPLFEVYFNTELGFWGVKKVKGYWGIRLSELYEWGYWKVIGNIYEDKHLLEWEGNGKER